MCTNLELNSNVYTYTQLGVTTLNDLAHGEFGKWLQSINMHHDTANKMMKIANELNSNSYTYMNLGSRALYEIATLPEEERTKEHTTSKGAKLVKT